MKAKVKIELVNPNELFDGDLTVNQMMDCKSWKIDFDDVIPVNVLVDDKIIGTGYIVVAELIGSGPIKINK